MEFYFCVCGDKFQFLVHDGYDTCSFGETAVRVDYAGVRTRFFNNFQEGLSAQGSSFLVPCSANVIW